MIHRRVVALVAIFAVSFGALWPLVSAAGPKATTIPSFICTQAGDVEHPSAPAKAGADFHCPLCIASADGVVAVMAATHAAPDSNVPPLATSRRISSHQTFHARPPPSRAPPLLS